MKDRFDLIIFDWDGTLVDSIDWIVYCLQKAARAMDYEVPDTEAVKSIIGLSINKAMETLFPGIEPSTQEQFVAYYNQEFFSKNISKDDLFAGVDDMLIAFKQAGYQLAIATGKSRNGLNRALEGTGLTGFFSSSCCADETASKPHPQMIKKIIQGLGVKKSRVVLVGDSIHDMQMAKNAGIAVIAVSCGANTAEQLQRFKPLLNLQKTTDLLEALQR